MNFKKLMTQIVIFSGLALADSNLTGWAQDPTTKEPGQEKDQRERFSDGGVALDPKGPLKAYQKLDAEYRLEKIQFQMVMEAYSKIASGTQYRVPEEGLLVLLDLKRNKGIYFYDDTWEPKKEEEKLKKLASEGKIALVHNPRDYHPKITDELARAGTKTVEELKTEFEHRMHVNAQMRSKILDRHPEIALAMWADQQAQDHKGFEIEEAKQDSTTVNKDFRRPASQEAQEDAEALALPKKGSTAVTKAKTGNH